MNPDVSTTNIQQNASFKSGRPMREIIAEGHGPITLSLPTGRLAWELATNKAKIDG
jgi:hypothetical protein